MRKSTGIRRRRAGLAAVALTSLLAAGCSSAVNQADEAAAEGGSGECQQGGTVVAANSSAPEVSRVLAQSATNLMWARAVFEPLINVSTVDLDDPQPALATEWEISDDGLSAVLQLREGVAFHTGRAFTADDVVFTMQQALDPATVSDVKAIVAGWEVEATGEHEVTITSQTPLTDTLASTLALTPIVDSETYAGLADGSQIIGTGPFTVESYSPGADIVLTKNDDYWQDGLPYLDRIESTTIPDSTAQVSSLRSGRAQLSNGLTVQDALSVTEGNPQFELLSTINGTYPIILDAVEDQRVRQAIGHAIDRDRINEQVFGGRGTTDGLYWAAASANYPEDLTGAYEYDPEQARQLIEEAGAAGTEVPITIINLPVIAAEYEIIANNLTEVGLTPTLTALAPPDYQQPLSAGTGGNYLSLRGLNGSPSFLLQTNADLRLEGAHRQFTSPEYTELATAVIGATTAEESAEAVHELTEYMNDQAFLHPLVTVPGTSVQSTDLQDVDVVLGGWVPATTCYVE
ncbi:ABC transporter substrate-binding protein [Modestobacter marinus]|uniref:ABC transporter substrate-binding protein n=1 Tax=Modestobacter marinus TaxID=477641 RepID=UPI00201B0F4F|nr:ABC transporter substrate-binding protein [Modestobacter marinus]